MQNNNITIEQQKSELRKSLSQTRKIAHQNQNNAEQKIITQFLKSPLAQTNLNQKYVSGYLPIASEINPIPLLEELRKLGAIILMPAVIKNNQPLEFRLWNKQTKLITETLGTQAPHPDSKTATPDIICAPLLAFDAQAYRLGYGGGFYDRSIANIKKIKPCIAIGLAYQQQKINKIPRNKYDMQLNAIITPENIYQGEAL